MLSPEYQEARDLAVTIADAEGLPSFYEDYPDMIDRSRQLFVSDPVVEAGMDIIIGQGDILGHGLAHVRKVAVDLGALILIDGHAVARKADLERLVLLGHLAAVFHDIKRSEKNHARLGAQEAARILADFPITAEECTAVAQAIGNHEAFQPAEGLADPRAQIISDALYDADKFRWGPDNFTDTLWAMVAPRQIPLEKILSRFLEGLEGIRLIRGTFRTPTGRIYGPDFIDRGLAIGRRLHEVLTIQQERGRG